MRRSEIILTANWYFHLGEGLPGVLPDYEQAIWTRVKIPHSWNAADTFVSSRGYYRGVGWYKTAIRVDETMMKNRLMVEFGAAYGFAEIWINGIYKDRYLSGYTGFAVDITKEVRPGIDNLLAVRCCNLHEPQILPGREIPDYNLFGGLYREVKLVTSARTGFDWQSIKVQTVSATPDRAYLKLSARINHITAAARSVTASISCASSDQVGQTDQDGGVEQIGAFNLRRASDNEFSGEISIENPQLWSPEAPALYMARFDLTGSDGKLLDQTETKFGIRTACFDPQHGFFLNGQPLKLKGVNRHQCYPGLGNAVPASLQVEDALLIKQMGANFVRTSHYPQHKAFLDACDRLGLLVFAEIASWQTISGEAFKKSAYAMLKEMIERDVNHPSIIIWGIMNEGRDRAFFLNMHQIAKQTDPNRDTAYADNKLEEGKRLGTVTTTDILGVNYQLDVIDAFHQDYPNVALLVAEYANSCVPRGNEEGMLGQLSHIAEELNLIESREYIAGSALWSFHDYGSDYEFAWPVQLSGVVDAFRLPKYTYHYLSSRWLKTPQVYIAGHWTYPGEEGNNRQVVVISNCQIVELYVNGSLAGTKQGKEIYTFDTVYQPGCIRAVGRSARNNEDVGDDACGFEPEDIVAHQVSTTSAAVRLSIDSSANRLPADNSAASVLTVRVLDAEDNLVVHGRYRAELSLSQSLGELFGLGGSHHVLTEAGLGRIVFRSGLDQGRVRITVSCDTLVSDSCQIELTEPTVAQDDVISDGSANSGEANLHKGQWNFL